MSDYLDEMDHLADEADPTTGDLEIQNFTINFGRKNNEKCEERSSALTHYFY